MLRNLLVALVAGSVTAATLHQAAPLQTVVSLDRERVWQERDRCQVLFVGPSFAIHQFKPKLFDAEAARLHMPLRSCLFGGTGMHGVELRVQLLAAERSFLDFAFFVSFFPQLVAGPIVRARDFLPQLAQPRVLADVQGRRWLLLFLFGFLKKRRKIAVHVARSAKAPIFRTLTSAAPAGRARS